jgi:hypothetical protein
VTCQSISGEKCTETIATLRAELAAARERIEHLTEKLGEVGLAAGAAQTRAEAAEKERDELRVSFDRTIDREDKERTRANAAEAQVRALREALEEALRWADENREGAPCSVCGVTPSRCGCWVGMARAAIAASPGAAPAKPGLFEAARQMGSGVLVSATLPATVHTSRPDGVELYVPAKPEVRYYSEEGAAQRIAQMRAKPDAPEAKLSIADLCHCAWDQVPLVGPNPSCPDCKGTGLATDGNFNMTPRAAKAKPQEGA